MSTSRSDRLQATYHHGDLRRALVTAAMNAVEGGAAPSLREIASTVGVTPTAAYRHFADKQALLTAVAALGFKRLGRAFSAQMSRTRAAPEDALPALGRAYLAFARKHPHLFQLMFSGIRGTGRSEELSGASGEAYALLQSACALRSDHLTSESRVAAAARLAWTIVHGRAVLDLAGYLTADAVGAASDHEALRDGLRGIDQVLSGDD